MTKIKVKVPRVGDVVRFHYYESALSEGLYNPQIVPAIIVKTYRQHDPDSLMVDLSYYNPFGKSWITKEKVEYNFTGYDKNKWSYKCADEYIEI